MKEVSNECPSSPQELHGHLFAKRVLGKVAFATLRQRRGVCQLVSEAPELVEQIQAIPLESCIEVEGHWQPVPNKPGEQELHLTRIELVSKSEQIPVEISKISKMEKLGLATIFDYRPLTLRTQQNRALFSLAAKITKAFEEFLEEREFTRIFSPKLVETGTEGGANLFSLDYFGKTAFLAQSPQFYKQAMVGVYERVYEVGPVFRAEPHSTSRHLNEYISLDVEMGFINNEQELMSLETELVRHILGSLRDQKEVAALGIVLPELTSIPEITVVEALELLASKYNYSPAHKEIDLDPEAERLLCQHFLETENCEFVFVSQFPLSNRPFYTRAKDNTSYSAGFDLLFAGLEITTGGMRIHEYEKLVQELANRKLPVENYQDYLQCFKYGMPPHGGFAIGLERLTAQLAGLSNVKLASLFPRDINRLSP